jgi:hypothetical protein
MWLLSKKTILVSTSNTFRDKIKSPWTDKKTFCDGNLDFHKVLYFFTNNKDE